GSGPTPTATSPSPWPSNPDPHIAFWVRDRAAFRPDSATRTVRPSSLGRPGCLARPRRAGRRQLHPGLPWGERDRRTLGVGVRGDGRRRGLGPTAPDDLPVGEDPGLA